MGNCPLYAFEKGAKMDELNKTAYKIESEQVRKALTRLMNSFELTNKQLCDLIEIRGKLDKVMREVTK